MSDANDTTPNVETSDSIMGRVKWFNNRAGFGFVTVLSGDKKNEDVFVHHTGINVDTEQYKYLVQGEYVSFVLKESDSSEHPYQAGSVRGILQGPLMCETRNANRSTRDDEGEGSSRPRPRRRVRPRGAGPRGRGRGEDGQNWVLERSGKSSSPEDQEA
jgi:cold shock CspA family protein